MQPRPHPADRHESTTPSIPEIVTHVPVLNRIWAWCLGNLNFYRVHLLWFTIVPLISSGVFYASNGSNHIAYIDCLFMTVSPMTMTGLETVLMASLTTWQQVIVFLLMVIGSTSSISIIMIVFRLHYFRKKFRHVLERNPQLRLSLERAKRKKPDKISADMIHRVLTPPSSVEAKLPSAEPDGHHPSILGMEGVTALTTESTELERQETCGETVLT